MPKGVMSGNPTNIVCWLVGGHYNDTVWSIAYDRDNLVDEIDMCHYENKRAKAQGVKILGITEAAPDDVLVEETYTLVYYQDHAPAHAIYVNNEILTKWEANIDRKVAEFQRRKGYDLPEQYLDPKNMPGKTRKVDV